MDKESIFFSCLTIMIIFEVGYYFVNPTAIWNLGISAITSIITVALIVGIILGVSAFTFSLSDTTIGLVVILSSLLTLMVQIDIPLSYFGILGSTLGTFLGLDSIPVGIGLLYPNITSIFITANTDIMSIIGLILVSIIMLITVVSAILIARG